MPPELADDPSIADGFFSRGSTYHQVGRAKEEAGIGSRILSSVVFGIITLLADEIDRKTATDRDQQANR